MMTLENSNKAVNENEKKGLMKIECMVVSKRDNPRREICIWYVKSQ